jgi:hypothetical protein
VFLSEVLNSHSGVAEESGLLGCDATGYGNTINEPTGSGNRQLSDKIMVLYHLALSAQAKQNYVI